MNAEGTPPGFFLCCEDTPDTFLERNTLPVIEDARYLVSWSGLPLLAGFSDPRHALAAVLECTGSRPIHERLPDLEGIHALVLFSKMERCWYVVADAAGMLRLFHDRRFVTTNFLELITRGGYGEGAVDPLRLVEFVLHEGVFGSRTPVRDVRVLTPDRILRANPRSGIELLPRQRDVPTEIDLAGYFTRHTASLSRHRISVDLTGGADSRVVFALATKVLRPIEACVIGGPGSPDVGTATDVARSVGIPLIVRQHVLDRLDSELWQAFRDGDGLTDLAHFHPNWQNLRTRRARGIDLVIHGGGGELFRDAYGLQDFPFYDVIPPRLERFYDWRLSPLGAATTSWLHDGSMIQEVRNDTLATMRMLSTGANCTTYDTIFFVLKAPALFGQFYSNYVRMGCAVVAPFLDWRNAAWAIRQPGRKKAFHRFHRRLLTEHAPELARMPTAEGYGLTTDPLAVSRDLLAYSALWVRKIGRKAAQRLIGRTWFLQGSSTLAEAHGFVDRLRESPELARALEALTRVGVARSDARPDSVHPTHLGRVLTVGMLVQFLAGRR